MASTIRINGCSGNEIIEGLCKVVRLDYCYKQVTSTGLTTAINR